MLHKYHSDPIFRGDIEAAAGTLGVAPDWETDPEDFKSGDMYLAKRNGPVTLLEVLYAGDGMVFPKNCGYPYNYQECVRVIL